jgi:DNA polymerase-1
MNKLNLLDMLDNIKEHDNIKVDRHDRVLVIDGLNMFFRNFAVVKFINNEGTHIGGLSGFLRSLGALIKTIYPTSVYVIFDGVGSTVNRKNLLPEYKENRHISRITNWDIFENLEDEHNSQIDQITRLIHYLKCLPIKTIALDRSEADDVISYISTKLSNEYNSKVFIVSNDKDFIQLVNSNISVYRPSEKDFYNLETVIDKFGIPSENFILYKVLLGDNSDKIKGIKGMGEKALIKRFPEIKTQILTLDDILRISEERLKEHVIYARILSDIPNLRRNFQIMNLHNPMIDDNGKKDLDELILDNTPSLDIPQFLEYYEMDGLRNAIKNVEYWIENTFRDILDIEK